MKVKVPEGTERSHGRRPPRKRGLIRCPMCRSHRLINEMVFIGGTKYVCQDCGFRGALVVSDDGEGRADGKARADGEE